MYNGYWNQDEATYIAPQLKDLNGDGLPDLIFTSGSYLQPSAVTIYYSQPGGGHSTQAVALPTGPSGYFHLDTDTLIDFYSVINPSGLILYRNTGSSFIAADTLYNMSEVNKRVLFYDLDGDGDDDLFQQPTSSLTEKVYLNQSGHFGQTQDITFSLNAPYIPGFKIEVVQLLGSADPEFVVFRNSLGSDTVTIFTKTSSTIYSIAQKLPLSTPYNAVYSVQRPNPWMDLNQDGLLDFCDGVSSYLLQDAGHRFSGGNVNGPISLTTVNALDLNRDGMNEGLVRAPGGDSLGVLHIDNSGTMSCPKRLMNSTHPGGQIFDVDGDGIRDYVVGETFNVLYHHLLWYKGRADGRFVLSGEYTNTTDGPVTGFASDRAEKYNELISAEDKAGHEGYLIVANRRIVFKATGQPDLVFRAPDDPSGLPYYNQQVEVVDMDGDGHKDVSVQSGGSTYWFELYPNAPHRTDLTWCTVLTTDRTVTPSYADVNQDGRHDLIYSVDNAYADDSIFVSLCEPGMVYGAPSFTGLVLDNGNINAGISFRAGGYWVKDVDLDSRPDIVLVRDTNNATRTEVLFAKGLGNGQFLPFRSLFGKLRTTSTALNYKMGLVYDWDGDHYPDAYDVDATGSLIFRKGGPSGPGQVTVIAARAIPTGGAPLYDFFQICISDFNQDDKADLLLVPRDTSYDCKLFLSNSAGGFDVVANPLPDYPYFRTKFQVALSGDVNGDGYPDVLMQERDVLRARINRLPSLACVKGRVFWDSNHNCQSDTSDQGLRDWPVIAGPSGYMALTDDQGRYILFTDTATQTLAIVPPGGLVSLVDSLCQGGILPVPAMAPGLVASGFDFGVQLKACYRLSLNLAATSIHYCGVNRIGVECRNDGTITSDTVAITLNLPSPLTLQQVLGHNIVASPFQSLGNGQYRILLGAIPANSHRNLMLEVDLACEDSLQNRALCLSATLSPQSTCDAPGPLTRTWDGSVLRIRPACQANSTQFTIRNQGQSMADSSRYRCFRQDGIVFQGRIKLAAGDSITLGPFAGGLPYYILVHRSAGSPDGVYAAASGLPCGSQTMAPDFASAFPQDEQPGQVSLCLPIRTSLDPNQKEVFPTGAGVDKKIPGDTRLHYVIHFENAGSDTAYNVVVRDTLSEHLDPATFTPGPVSHGFTHTVVTLPKASPGEPLRAVVTFHSSAIRLPYTDVDSLSSQGFVSFSVRPKTGSAQGTRIANTAGIYFDGNPVVWTNTVQVMVSDSIIGPFVAVHRALAEPSALRLAPNPAYTLVRVQGLACAEAELLSLMGQKILSIRLDAKGQGQMRLQGLPAGLYVVRSGQATQRLVVEP